LAFAFKSGKLGLEADHRTALRAVFNLSPHVGSRWASPWRFLIGRAPRLSVRNSQLDKGVIQVDGWWWMVVDAPDANQDDRKRHDDES